MYVGGYGRQVPLHQVRDTIRDVGDKKSEPWELKVTVLIPRDQAATDDEAIDLLGQRLKPWYWAAQLPMEIDE